MIMKKSYLNWGYEHLMQSLGLVKDWEHGKYMAPYALTVTINFVVTWI
jgi:hypothetical protein